MRGHCLATLTSRRAAIDWGLAVARRTLMAAESSCVSYIDLDFRLSLRILSEMSELRAHGTGAAESSSKVRSKGTDFP